jgi:hypothetical protein
MGVKWSVVDMSVIQKDGSRPGFYCNDYAMARGIAQYVGDTPLPFIPAEFQPFIRKNGDFYVATCGLAPYFTDGERCESTSFVGVLNLWQAVAFKKYPEYFDKIEKPV